MKAPASTLPQWSYGMAVMSRAIAAILGGYSVACLAAAGLAASLPLTRSDAVMAAQMLFFVVYTCAVLLAWMAQSPSGQKKDGSHATPLRAAHAKNDADSARSPIASSSIDSSFIR
jgi:cyanate permease